MPKYIILNEEGASLRNLPSAAWNSSLKNSTKQTYHWTFSSRGCGDISKGEYSPTLKKALAHLASKGFTNVRVVPLDEEIEQQIEEVKATKAIQNGKKQPRTNKEARDIIEQIDPSILEEPMYDGVQERCLACTRSCKQSPKVFFYVPCPQFSSIGEIIQENADNVETEKETEEEF